MFLLCSFLIWFINNLSESYINRATFDFKFINVPDSLMLTNASKKEVDVKVEATGFQFLGFNVKNKEVMIDLSTANQKDGKYYIAQSEYQKQIDKQLRSMTLLEIDKDTLFFEFTQVGTKKVPIKSRVNINLSQNFILDGPLKIEPSMITIKGPKTSIDTINSVYTFKMNFPEETSNFTHKVELFKDPELKNTTFSNTAVFIYGKVARFSEKMVNVPIKVINLPAGYEIRTFPDAVSVLCRGKLDNLKNLDGTGFEVVADYNSILDNTSKTITLELLKMPESLHSADLNQNQVEFILKRQ
ncbi:MAG: YbbR-like domain-containing protein [Maribacter sp.]